MANRPKISFVMSFLSSDFETAPIAVQTCVCGYDLTGLPASADARCPECGVLVAGLSPRTGFVEGGGRWLLAAIAACLLAALYMNALLEAPTKSLLSSVLDWLAGPVVLLCLAVAAVASVRFTNRARPTVAFLRRSSLAGMVFLLCLLLGIAVFFAVIAIFP